MNSSTSVAADARAGQPHASGGQRFRETSFHVQEGASSGTKMMISLGLNATKDDEDGPDLEKKGSPRQGLSKVPSGVAGQTQ
jgi:hypothetical protein